jgi:hypothetical protein
MNRSFKKPLLFSIVCIFLTSCTIYTEKRSEVLSQSVFATSESIEKGRIELAYKYAQEAKKVAYPPKKPITINQLKTRDTKQIQSVNSVSVPTSPNKNNNVSPIKTNVITSSFTEKADETVLRLVIPEFLKDAKLLIENSDEWNELLKIKEFKEQVELENQRLKQHRKEVEKELLKQQKYNNEMVIKLNEMQKSLIKKDLHILKLYISIVFLVAAIGGGVYLRMKGIL